MRMACLVVVSILVVYVDAWGQPQDPELRPAPKFGTLTEVIRDHEWGDAISNLLDVVDAMPAEDFGYRPAPAMRSFGEIVGHIANVHYAFCDMVKGAPKDRREDLVTRPAKADAVAGLRASIAFCDDALDSLTDARLLERTTRGGLVGDAMITMTGHSRRETGKLVAYLTSKGLKAPEVIYQKGRRWRTAPH